MQMWKCSLRVHSLILRWLYWQSKLLLKPRWWKLLNPIFVLLLTCSAASGSRWVSSRGTVNWIFLGLPVSMVALSVKKGNGTKRRRRRTEWSTQRKSKRRIRSSGRESEMKNKWAPGLKWDHCLLVLSGLCFSTFFGLRSSTIDSIPFFFLSPQHLLVSLLSLHSPSYLWLPASTEARAF